VLHRRYIIITHEVLLSFPDKIEGMEQEQELKRPKSRLLWMDIELVVCAVYVGDFYTVINKELDFRDVVIISRENPFNGHSVHAVIIKGDLTQERNLLYDQRVKKILSVPRKWVHAIDYIVIEVS
jgi:hypothetical protein